MKYKFCPFENFNLEFSFKVSCSSQARLLSFGGICVVCVWGLSALTNPSAHHDPAIPLWIFIPDKQRLTFTHWSLNWFRSEEALAKGSATRNSMSTSVSSGIWRKVGGTVCREFKNNYKLTKVCRCLSSLCTDKAKWWSSHLSGPHPLCLLWYQVTLPGLAGPLRPGVFRSTPSWKHLPFMLVCPKLLASLSLANQHCVYITLA